jgi:hypothetical protein
MCSVAEQCAPVAWAFSISAFHRFLATKPVRSETKKAERSSNVATIVLSESRSRTRVSREPHSHLQRNPQRWSGLAPRHSSCCGFRCWASKHTPLHTINTMVAIFLAKVSSLRALIHPGKLLAPTGRVPKICQSTLIPSDRVLNKRVGRKKRVVIRKIRIGRGPVRGSSRDPLFI